MDFSTQDIKFIAGIGPKRADMLNKELGIRTVDDLLRHYPYKYVDRSRFYYLHEISEDMPFIQVKGRIVRFEKVGEGRNQRLTAAFSDGHGGVIELVWFKGIKYILDKYKVNTEYVVFGKPTLFNGHYNIAHPEMELLSELPPVEQMGLQPFYNTTEKMKNNYLNSKAVQKIVFSVVQPLKNSNLPESLPEYVLKKYALLNLKESLQNIHFPQNAKILNDARQRLKFEELFYIQLSILQQTSWRNHNIKGLLFEHIGYYFNKFYNDYLPFELTGAQKRVLREIRIDVGTGKQMNRLLQGDVGSGKTLVALMAMLMAVDNGYQAAMMAPTEILATQHFVSLTEMLGDLGVNVALLTGSTKLKEREKLHEQLRNGELHLLVGTHALIEDTVQFKNLGLVVIDEQHRFGVEQRARLWRKNVNPPHVLVMTATPIPRTLAMTLYGDLSVSVIDELPPGRKPIQTFHYYQDKRNALNGFIAKQIEAGRQVYIVYPLIQESEKMDLRNLEEGFEYMREAFPQYQISMVHGKMKAADKDYQMQKFVEGKTRIMVATTVIEVGVNVPNASVMVIENAERFGLSQLHQLRGRVGRGADQSFCILLTSYKLSADTRKRMEIMVRTKDGFEISEADLQLRGPGDLDGTQQSGIPFDLKIANLAKDGKMLEIARQTAMDILEEDPMLEKEENKILALQLRKMRNKNFNWSVIG
ncbi:ATP-dependent DNA helicase RecG [Paludibacter sp. 221]|uniref:ATP-dependent DNA helicase RecG n=1 Tax=Paludibacter sp. 221 TaxID=2302939 RepID=UPI0013D66E3B|nr:ATP-dependent DNA helicase RecG [Paludibacter sp. 221]NDV46791.1 ATP-dependent DNA helicase RecG [Paludibacter sp. 221]